MAGVTAKGLQPAIFELVDRHCLRAVRDWERMDLPDSAAALLLAQTDLAEPSAEHEAAAILVEFERAGAKEALASTDQVEAEALFDARRLAYPALEQRGEAIPDRGRLPAARPAGGHARPDRADRTAPRRADREHRACRRWQPAPR